MRASLIIFGVIFLVLGGLFYFVPMQEIRADTTTVGDGGTDTRTSSARVTVPIEWAYASAIIGFILLMFGLAIPNTVQRIKEVPGIKGPRGPRGRSYAYHKRSAPLRRPRRKALPRSPPAGTTTTTTTRVNR